MGALLSTRRNYRRGVEHGSAKWGSPERLNRKYCAKPPEPNKVFTQHIRMGLDGRKHRRNLNVLVVGGSGAGRNCMRMSFGNNSPEKIREGVMKLGKLIEKKLAQQSK